MVNFLSVSPLHVFVHLGPEIIGILKEDYYYDFQEISLTHSLFISVSLYIFISLSHTHTPTHTLSTSE